jgi:hypothetical protein
MNARLSGMAAKGRALVAGTQMAMTARGLTPWARADALTSLDYRKVFVVGCARSGTTWVNDILCRHPRVLGGGESHVFPVILGSIGTMGPRSARAWTRVFYSIESGPAGRATGGLHQWVDQRTFQRLARAVLARHGDSDATARDLIRAVLDSYLVRAGGTIDDVLVEKTPRHLHYAEYILERFPEAQVVEVVRDGRDVCVSMEMRNAQLPVFPATRQEQINRWVHCVEQGLALRSNPAFAGRVSLVRYEDLEANPAREVARLLRECDLAADDALVDQIVSSTDIGLYPTGVGEFRYRGESGSWTKHFGPEDERLFRATAGEVFERLGYSF